MKRILSLLWALAAAAVADAAPSGVVSEPMALDIESGARSEEVIGALAYDTLWQGVTNADYRILVNGAVLASGSGAGMVAWHPTKYGTYTLAYQAFVDNVKVGEDMSATFTLAGKDLVNAEITLAADEVLYDGTARCPKVTIVYLAETLVEGADYTLEYENNVNPGVATMTIRGKGRFSDVLEKNFTIRPAGICSLDIESGTRIARTTEPLMYDSCWFAESNSLYKMYVDGKELAQGSGVGANSWTPRGVGDHLLTYRSYSGGYLASDEYQARFRVNGQDLVHATVTFNDETILYDGTERKPSITLTLGGKTLVEGADYSLTYSNNINPGVGIITVTGLGSYVDILDVPFTIRPAGVCFLDIEGGTRTVVGPVPLTYDATWNGDTNQMTRMELLSEKNGGAAETLSDSLTNVGQYDFAPDKDASYKVTLNTYINETLQTDEKIYTATFNYKAPVKPMPAAAVTVTGYSGKYDGEGHGLTVTVDPSVADPTVRYALSAEGPYTSALLMTNACGSTVWCEVSAPGYIPATNSAIVTITKRVVTLTSGGGSKKYDGIALTNWTFTVSGDDFVGDEGVTCTYSGTQTIVGSSKNTFDYALKAGTSADNYTISKVEGDLTVTASEIVNPFDPNDPKKPVTPEVLAKANCVTNYDGDGHSIEVVSLLNPLIAANNPQVTYSLLQNGTYEAQNPVFTNVVSTSVWYRIAADNFKPFTTNALLTIAPRSITKATMASIADQTYTGSAITPVPTVSDERTLIDAAESTNIITTADYGVSYADNVNVGTAKVILTGTNNYEGVATNNFQITPAIIPPGPGGAISATGYTNAYDGAAHGVSVTATGLKTTATVQYKSNATASWQDVSPTYTDVCDTQVWWKVSAPNYQAVEGTIGIKITSRPVTITSGTKTDFVYDGQPHEFSVLTKSENGFVAGEGIVTSNWATVTTVAQGEVANTFDYAAIEGTRISNYDITVVTGKIAVVAAEIDPSVVDPINPDPDDPHAPYSSYDVTVVYDGQGHTINTQALYAVTLAGATPSFSFSLESNGVYQTAPFVYTNIGEYVCWYKIEAPNYKPFVHQAKLTILKTAYEDCCLTFTSTNAFTITPAWEHDGVLQVSDDKTTWSDCDEIPHAAKLTGKEYRLYLRGRNNSHVQGQIKWDSTTDEEYNCAKIVGTNVCCNGNIEAVLDYRVVAQGNHPTMGNRCFSYMFAYCAALLMPPDLPATNLTVCCYNRMFCDCPSLMSVPALPAETLEEECYYGMFTRCYSLTTVPELPGTNLVDGCYVKMFAGCTNICLVGQGVGDYWQLRSDAKVLCYQDYPCDFQRDMFLGCDIDFERGPEPGKKYYFKRASVTPDGPVDDETSRYDLVVAYDGKEHAIKTNELNKVAYEYCRVIPHYYWGDVIYDYRELDTNVLGVLSVETNKNLTFTYSLTSNGVYQTEPFAFKDVVATSYWYKITSPGFADYLHEAQVTITNRPVTLTSATDSKEYDGTALTNPNIAISGLDWATGEGATYTVTGSQTDVGMSTNFFSYALNDGTKASNYLITKSEGTLTVTKGTLNPDDDPGKVDPSVDPSDPEQIEDPTIKFSPWDYVGMYDGAVHTVDTNAMRAAYAAVVGEDLTIGFMDTQDGAAGVRALPPVFKDVVATSFWYKVSSPNYEDIVHPCKVIITNRPVTVKSGTKLDFVYDGTAHINSHIIISESGFAAGEGIVTSNWATVTTVSEGEVANTFDYAPIEGTKLENYNIAIVTGKIAVVKGTLDPEDDPGKVDPSVDPSDPGQIEDPTIKFSPWDYVGMYDGVVHTIDTNAMRAAYAAVVGEGLEIQYAVGGGTPTLPWVDVAPVFKDVVATSFWYKVSSPNYEDIVHPCKVIITNRCVMMKSADGTWVWDGKEHSTNAVIVTVMDESGPRGARTLPGGMVELLEDETVETTFYKKWSEVGVTLNDFSIAWTGTAKEANYNVSLVTGKLEIVAAPAVTVTIVAQAKTNAYDGAEHRNDGFTWTSDNPLFTAADFSFSGCSNLASTAVCDLKMNLKPGDFALQGTHFASASFVIAQDGTLVITNAAPVTPEGPIDPIDPDPTDPSKPFSKYDFVGMYDGAEHTIDTNALAKVMYQPAAALTFSYALTKEGAYQPSPFAFKDVVTTSFWYKISAPNFADYVHQAKVTITNRPVTVTSGTKLDFAYDGKPHAYTSLTVTAGSFVAGEGIATSNWATVTTVAEGQVDNAFDYAPLAGTRLENYDFAVVTGKIAIAQAGAVTVTITGRVNVVTYDGAEKSVSGYDIVSISDPLYKATDFKFTGVAATNGIDAGTYPMGLKPSDFVNTNGNFSSVTFNVTDGSLVIAQAANEWTTTPAIEGWTYGETAKTPVGAAKFGTVAFAYDPTPVGDAGNYTMTASVAGTANYTALSKDVPFTIAKKTIPGGGDEPGGGEVPPGGLSKYDVTAMYDGAEHTIDTNKIAEAFKTVIIGAFEMQYAVGNGTAWGSELPAWKDVVATSLWYKVTSPNYNDYTHQAKVTITNRPVTVTSGTRLDFVYDGKPHAYTNLTVTAGSFVAGEGIATSNWATVTTVAEGQVDNAFDYAPLAGTKLENYDLAVVTGKIAIAQAGAVTVTVTGRVSSVTYDGAEKSVSGYDVVSISDPLYKATDFKFTGVASTNGTDAGTYPMGLKPSDFVNTNGNFSSVTFDVTDGWLKIEKGSVGPGGGDEPGGGEVPPGGLSKYDVTVMYDGEEHTIDTNNLVEAFKTVVVGAFEMQYAVGNGTAWGSELPAWKDVVATSLWYKVTSPNYEDYTHQAKVTITNRPVTVTSGTKLDFAYDGKPHAYTNLTVTAGSFVAGEGIATSNWAIVTTVAEGQVDNAFGYAAIEGTKLSNYDFVVVTGKIAIAQAGAVTVTITGHVSAVTYDGSEKSVSGYDIVSISDPLYKATDFKFTGVAATNGTDAGTYPMGLKPSDFVNTNGNFSSVTFNVTDGWLKIEKGALPPGDDPGKVDPGVDPSDPGQIEDPTIKFSPWDYVGMYDGEVHTVDTNAMRAAYAAVVGGEVSVQYAVGGGTPTLPWRNVAPVFKDVVATSFWYRISSPNYEDIIHPCKVIITNRCVTMKSADGTWVWDGKEHSTNAVIVTVMDESGPRGARTLPGGMVELLDGETVETTFYKKWSEVGVVSNDFSIAWTGTAKEANYNVSLVTGKLEIVAAPVTSVKVAFDALGGKIGIKSVVTQEVESVYGSLPTAVRENYLFQGWFLGVTNGAPQAVEGSALLAKGDHTLFAKWTVDTSITPDPETIYKWEAIDANTARITGFKKSGQQISKMIIPDTIGGRFVTEIAEKAFASAKCGATELALPVYLTKIGDKAFTSIRTTAGAYSLKTITFASVRRWNDPTKAGSLTIGAYAFSNATMLESLTLPAEVVSIGDYAFMNCRKMTSVTILGKPALGAMPFRSCGLDSGGVTVHIDPALASDADYMAKIKGGLPSVTVKTDAVITGLEMAGLSMEQGKAKLTLSVSRAASWGKVDASTLKVEYRATLDVAPTTLVPTAAENADGTVTLEVTVPQESSGFLRVVGEGER